MGHCDAIIYMSSDEQLFNWNIKLANREFYYFSLTKSPRTIESHSTIQIQKGVMPLVPKQDAKRLMSSFLNE